MRRAGLVLGFLLLSGASSEARWWRARGCFPACAALQRHCGRRGVHLFPQRARRCALLFQRLRACHDLQLDTPCSSLFQDPPVEPPIVDDDPVVVPDPDPVPLGDPADDIDPWSAVQQWAGAWRFEGHHVSTSASCGSALADIVLDTQVTVYDYGQDGFIAFAVLTGDYGQLYAIRFGAFQLGFGAGDFGYPNVTPEALGVFPTTGQLPQVLCGPPLPLCRVIRPPCGSTMGCSPPHPSAPIADNEIVVGITVDGDYVVCEHFTCPVQEFTAGFTATALPGFPARAAASLHLDVETDPQCGDAWEGVLVR